MAAPQIPSGMVERVLDYVKSQSTFKRNLFSTLAADIFGAVVSAGALMVANKFFSKQTKQAQTWIEQKVVTPHIDKIENLIEDTGDFHPIDEQLEAITPREKKAKAIAKLGFEMGATAPIGIGAAYLVHRTLDRRIGLDQNDNKMYAAAYLVDWLSHGVGLYGANKTFAHSLQGFKQTVSKVLQTCGLSKESADTGVNYIVNLELPNLVAAGTKLMAMELMSSRAASR